MNPEETMVNELDNAAADDALPEGVAEETDESEESLDAIGAEDAGEEEDKPAEETQKNGTQGSSEPGWIKQRVNKAVQRAIAETEARMQAMFDAQMAPIREKMLTDEARDLVRQGEFKSLERAKEYLMLKQGLPVTPSGQAEGSGQEQNRNEKGQFTPRTDPAVTARIDMLRHQADRIKAAGGPDVIAEFQGNEEIKKRVISGELDFYDVAEEMKKPQRRKAPAPVRSPNGASGQNPNAIDSMSDEQFARMEKRIKEGVRFALR